MIVRFAYLKQVKNNRTFTPGSAVSTWIQSDRLKFDPLGGTGVDAASTLIIDGQDGAHYHVNKAWSAVHAALTAATSADTPLNLF